MAKKISSKFFFLFFLDQSAFGPASYFLTVNTATLQKNQWIFFMDAKNTHRFFLPSVRQNMVLVFPYDITNVTIARSGRLLSKCFI